MPWMMPGVTAAAMVGARVGVIAVTGRWRRRHAAKAGTHAHGRATRRPRLATLPNLLPHPGPGGHGTALEAWPHDAEAMTKITPAPTPWAGV